MSRHRERSRRNLRLAQFSAVGLLALAGLLAAMSPPPVVTPAPPKPPEDRTSGDSPTARELNFDTASDVLRTRVHKTPLVVAAADPTPDEPSEVDETPEDASAAAPEHLDGPPHFNFIGTASSPRRTYAFIAEPDGTTRTIAQGDYYDDHGEYLVLGISSERIILADCDDTRHEYFISERPENPNMEATVDLMGGSIPTQQQAGVPNPPGNVSVNASQYQPIQPPTNMTDPAERERFLQEVEERRARAAKSYQPPSRPSPVPSPASPPAPAQRNTTPATKVPGNNSNVK